MLETYEGCDFIIDLDNIIFRYSKVTAIAKQAQG